MQKDIYILLTHSGTVLANTIKLLTKDKYVHAVLSLDPTLTCGYSFGRRGTYTPLFAGFVTENIYTGIYRLKKNATCVVYKISVTEEQYQALNKAIKKFERGGKKYRYNFIGLFALYFNRPVKREHHYFCSEFVAEVLRKSKIFNCGKKDEMVRAIDFLDIPGKEKIFEGKLVDYRNERIAKNYPQDNAMSPRELLKRGLALWRDFLVD